MVPRGALPLLQDPKRRPRRKRGAGLAGRGARARRASRYDHLVFCLGKVTNFCGDAGRRRARAGDEGPRRRLPAAQPRHPLPGAGRHRARPAAAGRRCSPSWSPAAASAASRRSASCASWSTRSLKYFPQHPPRRTCCSSWSTRRRRSCPRCRPSCGVAARRILEKRGIEMILDDARARRLAGPRLPWRAGGSLHQTFVCTVGNAPNPVAAHALNAGGFEEAQASTGAASASSPPTRRSQCLGQPGYWAVGDCAGIPNPSGQGSVPADRAVRHPRGRGVRAEHRRDDRRQAAAAVRLQGARHARVARPAQRGGRDARACSSRASSRGCCGAPST